MKNEKTNKQYKNQNGKILSFFQIVYTENTYKSTHKLLELIFLFNQVAELIGQYTSILRVATNKKSILNKNIIYNSVNIKY